MRPGRVSSYHFPLPFRERGLEKKKKKQKKKRGYIKGGNKTWPPKPPNKWIDVNNNKKL
jgi:hypothetical protein